MSERMTREAVEALLAKASAGPWFVVTDLPALAIGAGNKGYRVVQTPNQTNVRHFGSANSWDGIQSDANAALIAAAPTIARDYIATLDALDATHAHIAELETNCNSMVAQLEPLMDRAEAAERGRAKMREAAEPIIHRCQFYEESDDDAIVMVRIGDMRELRAALNSTQEAPGT